ncbi:MAG: tetratricopeptide repeat protein [Rhodanobacteraceae bacterium]
MPESPRLWRPRSEEDRLRIPDQRSLQSLQQASALLRAGEIARAREILQTLVNAEPGLTEAHRLLAGSLHASGDLAGAERALRHALGVDPNWAPTQVALGEILVETGRLDEGERHLRAGFAASRNYPRAAISLAGLLNDTDRAVAALEVTTPLAATASVPVELLSEHARALMALGRRDEAVATYRHVLERAPTSGRAELDLAAALSDSGDVVHAESAVRRALAKGFDTSKTWLVLALALVGQDRFDDAEAALRHAVDRWPTYVEAHRELANLLWMRSENLAAATAPIDTVLRGHPDLHALRIVKARLHEYADDAEGAYAIVSEALASGADTAPLHRSASESAMQFDPPRALEHARRAAALMPNDRAATGTLADVLISAGQADEAARLAGEFLARYPDDQHMLAVQATAWRLLDDPRYHDLYDYERLVHGWTIDTPEGWADLPAYLADLASGLRRLHTLKTHPIGQSLRHGTQTARDLMLSDDPAIRAFRAAIDGPIRRHVEAIGKPGDTAWHIAGMWSVQLNPNGYHANHVHPEGWLSSACYIDLPDAVQGDDRQGWIKFGEPALRTDPPLPPEHFVKPEPGLLVLFPSCMWHGTVPFSGDQRRLTIAFDVVRDG